MKKLKEMKKVALVLLTVLLLAGCGKQTKIVNMKEYVSPDGTYSIEADESYTITDMGMENWLGLETSGGLESLGVMQFPKKGGILGSFASLEEEIGRAHV